MGKNKLLISSLVLLASIFITQNIDAYTTNVLSDTNNYQILEINKEDLQEDATADLVIEDTLKESKKVEEKALIEANKAKNEQNLKTNQKSEECDPINDPECNKEECDFDNPNDPNCEGVCDPNDPNDPDCEGVCDPNDPNDPDCEIVEPRKIDINTINDWNEFAQESKELVDKDVYINANLNFANQVQKQAYLNNTVTIFGQNKTITNLKSSLVTTNKGTIKDLKIQSSTIRNNGTNLASFIQINQGIIQNVHFKNINLYGYNNCAPIANNRATINNVTTDNLYMICDNNGGAITGYNYSYDGKLYPNNQTVSYALVNNTKAWNIRIRSQRFYKGQKYNNIHYGVDNRNYAGDRIGGLVGYNKNASIKTGYVYNLHLRADDALGGIVGYNHKTTSNANKAIVENVSVNKIDVIGGKRVGGIAGMNYEAFAKNKYYMLNYKNSNYLKMNSMINKATVYGTANIRAHSEVAGLVGINFFSRLHNSQFKPKQRTYNVYSYYDEAAGAVGDNEFGYISNVKTNAHVKAKTFQAAGFVADNEGTIKNSSSTGKVYTKKELGGFVGSNLGIIYNSQARGNTHATKRVTIKYKVKKKLTKKERKKKKYKRKKYKYIKKKKYVANWTGNFAGYVKNGSYKGVKLKGKVYKSSYKNKRYAGSKKVKNLKYGKYRK